MIVHQQPAVGVQDDRVFRRQAPGLLGGGERAAVAGLLVEQGEVVQAGGIFGIERNGGLVGLDRARVVVGLLRGERLEYQRLVAAGVGGAPFLQELRGGLGVVRGDRAIQFRGGGVALRVLP